MKLEWLQTTRDGDRIRVSRIPPTASAPHGGRRTVGVDGAALDLHATLSCGGGRSLLRYDPGTNTTTVLLGPPVNGGGVIAALPYPGTE